MIYLLVIIILLLIYIRTQNGIYSYKKLDKVPYNFTLILFILIAGFRYRVGGDSLGYEDNFNDLPMLSDLKEFDFANALYNPLWYVFNAMTKSVNDNFYFFQLIHTAVVNITIFWFIKKYSLNKYLGIILYFLLYYLYFNTEILRESLAISAFLISVPYLVNKQYIRYYICCGLAYLFHSSAFILLFVPLASMHISNRNRVLLLISLYILLTFTPLKKIIYIFSFNENINAKLDSYTGIELSFFGALLEILKILPVLLVQYIRNKKKLPRHVFEEYVNIYLFIGILTSFIAGFYRLQNYFVILIIIYIVDTIVELYRAKYFISYYKTSICVAWILFFQVFYLIRDTSEYSPNTRFYNLYIPYHSIIDEEKYDARETLFYNTIRVH